MKTNNMKRKAASVLAVICLMTVGGGLLSSACADEVKSPIVITKEQKLNHSATSKKKTLNENKTASADAAQNEKNQNEAAGKQAQ